MPYFDLAFNLPLKNVFTYYADDKGEAAFGKRAMAPFRGRDALAYITGIRDELPPGLKETALKKIHRVVDNEITFDEKDLEIAKWISSFYFCGIGEALAIMIPSGRKVKPLDDNIFIPSLSSEDEMVSSPPPLSGEQKTALDEILKPSSNKMFYLYGITGSGKTEVFLRAAEKMINEGKSVIYLVPEISLTHQTLEAINERFSGRASVLHSGMSPAARLNEWMRIRKAADEEDGAKIVIGPRSAIFAPVKNLGLIIIDEEQDSSYKSGSTPRYHARQAAIKRCSLSNAILLMGSATPSIEAWKLMQEGTIKKLVLSKRLSGGEIPEIIPVSLEKTQGCLSAELKEEIRITASLKKQTILFLNRRGFAYYYKCSSCGYELTCKRCSVTLTWYKSRNKAICHYCGYSTNLPPSCPDCGSLETGFSGFGTEMIEEEVNKAFPELKTLRIDTDSTSKKGSLKKALEEFRAGKADILLGTQMVAKGLNFPGVALVGVVLADTGLYIPDFRSSERTFSLVVQVAGRSGRYFPDGKVIVQTLRPFDPAIKRACALDIEGFFEEELVMRKALNFPPYTRLIRFTLRSKDEKRASLSAARLASIAHNYLRGGTELLGPSECPVGIISGQHRRQVLLRSKTLGSMQAACGKILDEYNKGRDGKVFLEIDVDPVSLL